VSRGMLNLGILAHVDAGKTTLTERLLFAAGVIDAPGSVDKGTTLTDSLALERERGITIKSAVASFPVADATVNLIDTPGHPDFIAEVERALSVLDGVVLVISAVESVQPQTRILWRALRRQRVPTVLFVNKIDRRGADDGRVLRDIARRLSPSVIPMGPVEALGTRDAAFAPLRRTDAMFQSRLAEVLADHDDAILAAYLDGQFRGDLAESVKHGLVFPVYFGSAMTGAGTDALMTDITALLPLAPRDADGPVSARVFKIERGPAGDRVGYVRMFSGSIRVRDRVRDGKVTAISVFADGDASPRDRVSAGQIARLSGLASVRVGDVIGASPPGGVRHHFPPPTLETAVMARSGRDKARLHAALSELAEQDPLINIRQDDVRQELYVSLYGEVQKQVIEATLAAEYGLAADFRETTPICVERPARTGMAEEVLHAPTNPFLATLGFRIDPASAGSGIEFRSLVGHEDVPLFIYKNSSSFASAIEEFVRETLREGLHGWPVTDCVVTLVRSGYSVFDGPPSRRGPTSGPQDFRKLTPLVVMAALRQAGTVVCAPVHRFRLDVPADTLDVVIPALAKLRAIAEVSAATATECTLEGDVPASRLHELRQLIAPLTRGEGVLETALDHYEPVQGSGSLVGYAVVIHAMRVIDYSRPLLSIMYNP
jgi:ribosomal protection tetracycline resistance protein